MSVEVTIPTQLRPIVGGTSKVESQGSTVDTVLEDLGARYPSLLPRLVDEDGALRRFVNVYVDEEDIRFLQGLATPVPDGSRISIIPAIAGGAR